MSSGLPDVLPVPHIFQVQIKRLEARFAAIAKSGSYNFVTRRKLMEALFETKMAVVRLLFLLKAQKSLDSCDSAQSIAKEMEVHALICQCQASIAKLWQKLGQRTPTVPVEIASVEMKIDKVMKANRWFDFFRMVRPSRFSRVCILGHVIRVIATNLYSFDLDLKQEKIREFSLCVSGEYLTKEFLKRVSVKLNACLSKEEAFVALDRVLFGTFLVARYFEIVSDVCRVAEHFDLVVTPKGNRLEINVGSIPGPARAFEIRLKRDSIELLSNTPVFLGTERVMLMERLEHCGTRDLHTLMSKIRDIALDTEMRIKYMNWVTECPDAEIEYAVKNECPSFGHIDYFVGKQFMCSLENVPIEKNRLTRILYEIAWTGRNEHDGALMALCAWSLPGVGIVIDENDRKSAVIVVDGKVDHYRTIRFPPVDDAILRIRKGLIDLYRSCVIANLKNTIVNSSQKLVTMIRNCRMCLSFPFLETVFMDFGRDLSWTLRIPSYGAAGNKSIGITLRSRSVVANFIMILVDFLRRLAVYVKIFAAKSTCPRHSITIETSVNATVELDALFRAVKDNGQEFILGPYIVHGTQREAPDSVYLSSSGIRELPDIEMSFRKSSVFSKLLTEILLIPNEHDFRFFAFFAHSCRSLYRICYHFTGGMWSVMTGTRHFHCYVIFQRRFTLHIHMNGAERFTCVIPLSQSSLARIVQMAFNGVQGIKRREAENMSMFVFEGMRLDCLFEMKSYCEQIWRNVAKLHGLHSASVVDSGGAKSLCVEFSLQTLRIIAEVTVHGVRLTVKERIDELANLLADYLDQQLDSVTLHSSCMDFVLGLNRVSPAEACSSLRRALGRYDDNQKLSGPDRMDVFDDIFSV